MSTLTRDEASILHELVAFGDCATQQQLVRGRVMGRIRVGRCLDSLTTRGFVTRRGDCFKATDAGRTWAAHDVVATVLDTEYHGAVPHHHVEAS